MKGLHHDAIVHVRDTGRTRRRTLSRIALQPGADCARQRRRIVRHRHFDVTSIDVGVLMQRVDDAVPDVTNDGLGATVMRFITPRTPRICRTAFSAISF